jgi:hypothetical protein
VVRLLAGDHRLRPRGARAHTLGLGSGVGAACLTWRSHRAAIAAVCTLAALALAIVLPQVAVSESARQSWVLQRPLKLLFEGGFWALALSYLYLERRRSVDADAQGT